MHIAQQRYDSALNTHGKEQASSRIIHALHTLVLTPLPAVSKL